MKTAEDTLAENWFRSRTAASNGIVTPGYWSYRSVSLTVRRLFGLASLADVESGARDFVADVNRFINTVVENPLPWAPGSVTVSIDAIKVGGFQQGAFYEVPVRFEVAESLPEDFSRLLGKAVKATGFVMGRS